MVIICLFCLSVSTPPLVPSLVVRLCLPTSLSICFPTFLYWYVHMSYLSVFLSLYLSVYLSACFSIYLPFRLFDC